MIHRLSQGIALVTLTLTLVACSPQQAGPIALATRSAEPQPSSTVPATEGSVATTATSTATAGTMTTASATTSAPPIATTAPADTATPPVATTAATVELSDAELRAALEATVDKWTTAYNEASPELLRAAVDQTNLPVRRIQESLLKLNTSGGASGWNARILESIRRPHGYVQATVDTGAAGKTFVFKQVDGEWLISEPRRAELGKRKTRESEHFTFQYYDWDADIIDEIIALMEQAHVDMVEKLGRAPEKKPLVQIIPTFETAPNGSNGRTLAFYRRGSGVRLGTQDMVINSPNSFGFGSYDLGSGWQRNLSAVLSHEYVHLLNDCCFTPIARLRGWMIEGIAVYLSEGGHNNRSMPLVIQAVRSDQVLPIRASDRPPGRIPLDLESTGDIENGLTEVLAYALSATLVDYIVTNYGGLEGFWKLAAEFSETQDLDRALQNLHGITLEELEKGWRADLQKRYG